MVTSELPGRPADSAGGILVLGNCTISWDGETIFACNTAENYDGGSLVVHDSSQAFWRGETRFYDNWAGLYGVAMVVYDHSDVFGSGDTSYDRNSAVDIAEAVLVLDNCNISWSGETIFSFLIKLKTMKEVRSLYTTAL